MVEAASGAAVAAAFSKQVFALEMFNHMEVNGRLEPFRKLIRFDSMTCP